MYITILYITILNLIRTRFFFILFKYMQKKNYELNSYIKIYLILEWSFKNNWT